MAVSKAKLQQLLQSDQDLSHMSLATRIVVGRLRIEVQNSPAALGAKTDELYAFAAENEYAASELATI